jgi:Uncharacterized protein conserved in bacteria
MRKTNNSNKDIIWEKNYQIAKTYYLENGHLLIPDYFEIENMKIGRWIGTQRYHYNGKPNSLFTKERIKKLDAIGMIWDVKNNNWNAMYLELQKYKKKYKNVRVPQSYITPNGLKLGVWINKQRQDYIDKKIQPKRMKKLNDIKMIWNAKILVTNAWQLKYNMLKNYKDKHNKFPSTNYTENNIKLGAWLSLQRTKYNNNTITKERMIKLEELEIIWDTIDYSWQNMYKKAKEYYQKFSHLCIHNDSIENSKLIAWLKRQRVLYNKNKLTANQIKKLESINIVWCKKSLLISNWEKMYERAKAYFLIHGNINISKDSKSSPNRHLGLWLETQRKNYRKQANLKINLERFKRLEELNINWNPYISPAEVWKNWYEKAKEFYLKNKHLNPKKGTLKTWLFAQRAAKKEIRGHLTKLQIKSLESIGMIWDPLEENWQEMYKHAKEYYKIHQMLNIPVNYITENDLTLGIWISTQRKTYKNRLNSNNLTSTMQKRIKLLNDIGMIWDASTLLTNTSFQEKVIYYYLKQTFPDIKKISQWELIGYEFDIFIPSLNTAIEYDGIWHKDKLKKDLEKAKACKENGIRLIRIREPELPNIPNNNDVIELRGRDETSLEEGIKELFKLIDLPVSNFNIAKERSKILETYKDYNSRTWDKWYKKAYNLYKQFGSINKINNKSQEPKEIISWICAQKSSYKNNMLTNMQINKLENLNIEWNTFESHWQRMYKTAKKYFDENKNLLIPCYYKTEEGINLGKWISKQRINYKNKKLDIRHIQLLTSIGMIWSPNDHKRSNYYEEIKKYYNKYGHIKITWRYKTKEGCTLGEWLNSCRKKYKENKLEKEIVDYLNYFGMQWNIFDENWEYMFEIAKNYWLENGNIWISHNYVTSDGTHLGDWIARQRRKFNSKKNYNDIELEKIKKLNSINMVWNPYSTKWSNKYKIAKEYFDKHGHLNIPIDYITEEGIKLGMWIGSQRQAKRGNPNFLMTTEREKLLDAINIDWKEENIKITSSK